MRAKASFGVATVCFLVCACSNDSTSQPNASGGSATTTGGASTGDGGTSTGGASAGGSLLGTGGGLPIGTGTLTPTGGAPQTGSIDVSCLDVASETLTGWVVCGLGCSSGFEFPLPTPSERAYKLVQLAPDICADGLGGAGGLGGDAGVATLSEGAFVALEVAEFTAGAGQLTGNRFVVDEAPARVTFFPQLDTQWAIPIEPAADEVGDYTYAGHVALIDADTGLPLRIYAFRGTYSHLLI